MSARGRRLDARARCSTGRPRASPCVKRCIAEVMAAEGTTRRPRRRARHDRRPAGHRPRLQDAHRSRRRHHRRGADLPRRGARRSAPTRPTSSRSRWTSDGMRIDELEADARPPRRARAARPKFIYTVPTFQNPAGVTMSLPRRRRLVEVAARARAARARGQPLRPAALRGRPAADAATRSTAATSSSTSGRSRRSSRPGVRAGLGVAPAAGAGEDEPRQAGRRPVLVVADAVLRRRLLRERALAGLRATRCARSTAAGAT